MTSLRLFRGHGLGNDYLAVDDATLPFALSPPAVRLLCDRHVGVGSDGILVGGRSSVADHSLRIHNPDGSEAEKSGNGLRIFAAFLLDNDRVRRGRPFTVETKGGIVRMEVLDEAEDGQTMVEVEMGRASFRSSAVGLSGPDREVVDELLELPGGDRVAINTVSIGNPHCVCFEDELVVEDLRRRGPQISAHPWFAEGTNVQFVKGIGPAEVEAYVWERGAGETLASGSSACAVAAASLRRGLVQERRISVTMPGGTLIVQVGDEWDLTLRGPVESVCYADLTSNFLERLRELST